MKINNEKELKQRIEKALAGIKQDERYETSCAILQDVLDEIDIYDVDESKERLHYLHDADGTYPMHPEIASLLMDIYSDGIENEDADSMCNMGSLYYTGRCGEQNYEKAAYYYDMADKAGCRQATENMGYIYYYGRIGERDYEKAFQYFVKGALDGHLRSLYKVGDFYRNGYYVEKDPKEAFIIYDHCFSMMTDEAMPQVGADIHMRIGDCFYEGIGVERDLMLALRFMTSAEELFYRRLMEGDFYQQRNLEHVMDVEKKIREEIAEQLPDLTWSKYRG